MDEKIEAMAGSIAFMRAGTGIMEAGAIEGIYEITCTDEHGNILWREGIDNTVVTVGKNELLTDALKGAAYTVTGPYMLLISSTSFTAIAATDTMASHAGWLEAGGAHAPTYTGPRPTVGFGTAAAGALASTGTISFPITGSGTIQGIAMTFGTGATSTIDNTGGVLLSAGTLSVAQPVIATNTVTATWTLSL